MLLASCVSGGIDLTFPVVAGLFRPVAKLRLSVPIREAAKGKRVWITNRGKRVALLSSGVESTGDSEEPAEIFAGFRKFRSSARKGSEFLKSLIEEGRR